MEDLSYYYRLVAATEALKIQGELIRLTDIDTAAKVINLAEENNNARNLCFTRLSKNDVIVQ